MGGCSKDEGVTEDEPITPEITLSKDNFTVSKAGASLSVTVNVTTADGKWIYTISKDGNGWCTASSAVNSNTLKIKVSANSNEKSREATISIMADSDKSLRKSIKVKQAGASDGIIVEEITYEIPSKNHTGGPLPACRCE